MSKHDSTRRSFLVRAAVGAGAVAGSGLVPDAYTQTVEQHKDDAASPGQAHPASIQHGAFFNY
jgi:gluconate 2-dehydrogenase gamma chain